MKRLIDDDGLAGMDNELANLFRATPRFASDPFRKRRILARLERAPSRDIGRSSLEAVVVAGLLVSGTAAAALGGRHALNNFRFSRLGENPSASTSAIGTRPQAALAPQPQSVVEIADESAPMIAARKREPTTITLRGAGTSASPASSSSHEDATHVVQAIQALRNGKDPARARELLDAYLKLHPNGQLSGDALALSIEAASAQHDVRAADYARRYLAAYPKGKYRDLAMRALGAGR